MTILISVLSLAALVLAISCTVLFAIGAAIELLPESTAPARDREARDEGMSDAISAPGLKRPSPGMRRFPSAAWLPPAPPDPPGCRTARGE